MNHPHQRSNQETNPKQPQGDRHEQSKNPEAPVEDKADGEYTHSSQSRSSYSEHLIQSSEHSRTPRYLPPIPSLPSLLYKADPPQYGDNSSQPAPGPARNVVQTQTSEQYSTSAEVRQVGTWMPTTSNYPRRLRIGDEQSDQSGPDSDSDTQATQRRHGKAPRSMLSQEYTSKKKDRKKSERTDESVEHGVKYPFDSDEESQETQSTALTDDAWP